MMIGYMRLMQGLLLVMALPPLSDAQLAQADGRLPAGLIVHLDATAAEVGLIAELQDLAVATRVFVQPEEAARPEVVAVGESRVLRFDGVDDHLRSVGTGLESDAFTLFVVAAPHANPGDFRDFFAANAAGQRDYESGLTVDLGPGPSRSFDVINVEGKGFGHVFCIHRVTSVEHLFAPSRRRGVFADGQAPAGRVAVRCAGDPHQRDHSGHPGGGTRVPDRMRADGVAAIRSDR